MANRFSKRHYEMIAETFQKIREANGPKGSTFLDDGTIGYIEDVFADLLRRDNPAFQSERFLKACDPGANVRARS